MAAAALLFLTLLSPFGWSSHSALIPGGRAAGRRQHTLAAGPGNRICPLSLHRA